MSAPLQRVDLYTLVHKGLRARLCNLLVAAGRLDHSSDAAVALLLADLRETLALLARHAGLEDRHVHTAMERRRPGTRHACAREHAVHRRDLEELLTLALRLEHLPALRRQVAATELYQVLARTVAHQLEHLALEESVNNRVLWDAFSDDELRAIEQAMAAELTPDEHSIFLRTLLPHVTPAERTRLLSGMRTGMPAEAFAGVLTLAARLLPGDDMRNLESALGIERRPADYVGLA
ncbi:MAG: hypothetical protein ACOY3X_09595 [Pseudomonadota bacterium]